MPDEPEPDSDGPDGRRPGPAEPRVTTTSQRAAPDGRDDRRGFLKKSAVTVATLAGSWPLLAAAPAAQGRAVVPVGPVPWYRRTTRWMQTNISEFDPTQYDIPWWREQWKRTHTQGIVVNAGGIVAFYPTKVPFHRRAAFLGDRDLFGDLSRAAREDGIVVFARMDSNGAGDDVYRVHPDWFTRNPAGQPYPREATLHVPCVNGPYYREHIPAILREIASAYRPEGFTDNSWSGLARTSTCYCDNCRAKFRAERGFDLPMRRDWSAPAYRAWIEWSYACRLEIWDLFNRTAREAGGPDCLWVGMIGGTVSAAAAEFRDCREICRRSEMIMLDNQRRADATGFQANGQTGKLMHGLLGWDKLAPESMALYQTNGTTFRLSMRPEPEVRLWAVEALAAGIQPWWHYVNAYHEDRRMYDTPLALGAWAFEHDAVLRDRQPIAAVGIVYSQRNHDFFGRDDADLAVSLPQRGFLEALMRARIPYVFVCAEDFERDAAGLQAIVLPNLGAVSDELVAAVRAFVGRGGGLVATGVTSLYDRSGDERDNFALADLFGVRIPAGHPLRSETTRRQWAMENTQTYLRLTPALRARTNGPHIPGEPPATGERHAALAGFDATDILPYGGSLSALDVASTAQTLLTFVPPRPAFPPEAVWLENATTTIAGLVVHERAGMGRVAYLAADLDRRYARDNIGDHGSLLANLVRWVGRTDVPLEVVGPGLLDCHLYRQSGRVVLHLVNLTNAGTWRSAVEEITPVGPVRVRVRLPEGVRARRLRLLVSARQPALSVESGWARFELASIADHEVAVLES